MDKELSRRDLENGFPARVWSMRLASRRPGAVARALVTLSLVVAGGPSTPAMATEAPPVWNAGEYQYVVAMAAHSTGAHGAVWMSDLVIHNAGPSVVAANVYFLEKGRNNSLTVGQEITLAASSSVTVQDVVQSMFGRSASSGALLVGADSRLLVTSRTYSTGPGGTFGQHVEGVGVEKVIQTGWVARLIQLTRNADYRTNLAFANAKAVQSTIHVELFAAEGPPLGSLDVNLWPYGYSQVNDIFAKVGATEVEDGYALVSSPTPGAEYVVSASVVDNRSNDPVTVVPTVETGSLWSSASVPTGPEPHTWPPASGEPAGATSRRSGGLPVTIASSSQGWQPTAFQNGAKIIMTSPASPPVLYASRGGGVFRSTDGGVSWSDASHGLWGTETTLVAVDPTNPLVVYAASRKYFTSSTHPYGTAVCRTDDGGVTWAVLVGSGDDSVDSISIVPWNPQIIYSWVSGCNGYVFCYHRVLKSTDGGTTWAGVGDAEWPGPMAIDPTAPAVFWKGFSRSTDGGQTWSPVTAGLPADIGLYGLYPSTHGAPALYADTTAGLYKTANGSDSWVFAGPGLSPSWLAHSRSVRGNPAFEPGNPETIYIATSDGGLFRTTDAGRSWFPAVLGLPPGGALAFAIHPSAPGTVLAATGAGILRATFPGDFPCDVVLDPTSGAISAAGGSGEVAVRTWSECPWAAMSDAPWLTIAPSSGSGEGAAVWTAAVNPTLGSRTATLTIGSRSFSITQAGAVCSTPPAPSLDAPGTATSSVSYLLRWNATVPDDTYELQESEDRSFAASTPFTVTGISYATTHLAGGITTWHARVRAVWSCEGSIWRSSWSNVTATEVEPEPAAGNPIYLPAAAHSDGLAGTHWRTDLEVHNPTATEARFIVARLDAGQANPSPRGVVLSLPANRSARYSDVLGPDGVGLAGSGNATLRITPLAGTVITSQRTYNDLTTGTFGQMIIPDRTSRSSVSNGSMARLIGLAESSDPASGFRTNMGFASITASSISVVVELHRGDGMTLGTTTVDLGPYGYAQVGRIFTRVTAEDIPDGFAVLRMETQGACIVYASVVDNRSGDPIYIPARFTGYVPSDVAGAPQTAGR